MKTEKKMYTLTLLDGGVVIEHNEGLSLVELAGLLKVASFNLEQRLLETRLYNKALEATKD